VAIIRIIVTSKKVGLTRIYPERDKKGQWTLTASYKATMRLGKEVAEFAVSRNTITNVFGIGDFRECPASLHRQPFYAFVREDNNRGFRLQLCESPTLNKTTLMGRGTITRSFIQIHRGPGASCGCMSIAGGSRGHRAFEETLRKFLKKTDKIRVTVQQR
jgi:hypothetical protein